MSSTISVLYKTVHTAWLERRLENHLQRQKELATLHASIKRFTSQLIKALQSDLKTTEDSAGEEIKAVLDSIKFFYDALDFPGSVKKEKAIKAGANVGNNLVPLGPCLIDPNPHTPVSSTFIPLAAAVAAGSAVIVLNASAAPATSNLIKAITDDSLDNEAVRLTKDNSPLTRRELGSKCFGVAVLQNAQQQTELQRSLHNSNSLIRVLVPPTGPSVGFVDRSAPDLEAVASHIRYSVLQNPRHQPLRVPRLFFVDEIVIRDLEALLHRSDGNADGLRRSGNPAEMKALHELLVTTFPSLVDRLPRHSSTNLPQIISLNHTDPITADSIRVVAKPITVQDEGILLIPIRSLDHGIDLLDKINDRETSQATYIFGEGKSSFYVGMFSKSLNIFVNQIPQRSLVTIIPFSSTASYELPYRQEDFSINKSIVQARLGVSAKPEKPLWRIIAHKLSLRKIYQPNGGRLSYFERGLIVGLAVTIVAVSGISFTFNRGVRYYFNRS